LILKQSKNIKKIILNKKIILIFLKNIFKMQKQKKLYELNEYQWANCEEQPIS